MNTVIIVREGEVPWKDVYKRQLFELKFSKEMPEREFCIVTDKRNPMSPAGRRLLGMMIGHEDC